MTVSLTAAALLALPKTYYPLFDLCHIILCVLTVRKEAGKAFAHNHPLAAWVACTVSSFAGSLLANPLLGKPMFAAFSDEYLVLMSTIIFVAIFYSPGDVVYTFLMVKPVYLTICILKEIYRAKKIHSGFADGLAAFPSSPYLIPVTVAVLKGNGSAFMAPFARGIRGVWQLDNTEIMKPSVTTKECFLAAMVFAKLGTPDPVYWAILGLFISVKVGAILGSPVDPFAPVESALFAVVDKISPPQQLGEKEKKQ